MPWKNGGGSTTELMVEPALASLETGFLWRVSMAAVAASGPFSRFPGLDRTLLLLEGGGLRVEHGPHGAALLAQPLDCCRFAGEWDTHGALLAGPCQDFNVMSDRNRVRHEVSVLRPGPDPVALPQGPVLLVFCAQGRLRVPGLGATLGSRELLRVDGGPALAVAGLEPGSALIAVVFHPLAGVPGFGASPCASV